MTKTAAERVHPPRKREPAERLWSLIRKDPETGCWIWLRGKSEWDHPFCADGRHMQAHRYLYEIIVEPLPAEVSLRSTCGTPRCVSPMHREPSGVWSEGRPREDPIERFMVMVDKDGPESEIGGRCWLWVGASHGGRGGAFGAGGGNNQTQASRWSYEHFIGPIPPHRKMLHACRVPLCVNPAHLRTPLDACFVEGCEQPVEARDCCRKHYWTLYGRDLAARRSAGR